MPYRLKHLSLKDDTTIRFPEAFVEKFLREFTKKGDRVIDPFAGFGTMLFAAQRMGRIGIGIEYDRQRYAYIRQHLKPPSKVIHGDAQHLRLYDVPFCDFSLTSPPYMQSHHRENPLTNYTKPGNYRRYLSGIRTVYAQLKKVMKKGAWIILEVSNIREEGRPVTPLAWDIAHEVSKELSFEQELIYCHTKGTHSYCLLFRNR